ncbi:MAG: amidase family protein, partial [Myxococcota bacterium]
KSSYGISKLTGHLPHGPGDGFWSWLDLAVGGPMTRSAEDLQVGLLAGAGADPAEATGWKLSLPAPRARRLQHFRLAAWLDDAFCPIDSEVRKAIESAVESIRSKGGTVDTSPKLPMQLEEMTLPYRKLLYGAFAAFWPEEEFEEMRKVSTPGGRYQGHPDKPRVYADTVGDHRDWVRADIARNHAKAAWSEFFATYDAVLMPVTPTPALPHHGPDEAWFGPPMKVDGETRPYLDQISWTGFVNYIGNPSTSVPLSMSKDGLPIGMQLMGPYLEDLTVIELARALEQAGVAQYVQPAPLRS